MPLWGKGNRDKQQEILDARKSAEKTKGKIRTALFGRDSKPK